MRCFECCFLTRHMNNITVPESKDLACLCTPTERKSLYFIIYNSFLYNVLPRRNFLVSRSSLGLKYDSFHCINLERDIIVIFLNVFLREIKFLRCAIIYILTTHNISVTFTYFLYLVVSSLAITPYFICITYSLIQETFTNFQNTP